MSVGQNILFLFLGWLLGLLGPIVVDEIRRRRQVAQVKVAIVTELTELRLKLAFSAYTLAIRFGTLDRPLLAWVKSIIDSYSGPHADPAIVQSISRMLCSSDEDLTIMVESGRASQFAAVALKKYVTPVLDSQVATFIIFSGGFQNLLIELKGQLALLNEQVESAQFYYRKTFDSGLSKENCEVIRQNLKDTYIKVGERARLVADLVTRCLESK